MALKTLFLHPPSFQGFDGGAGARYQARREIRSFWYPTWLAQTAALVPGSRLVDAPPAGRRFYFRPRKLFGFLKEMASDMAVCRRRLAEGREFLAFLARRHSTS
jgi:hypothetical protein